MVGLLFRLGCFMFVSAVLAVFLLLHFEDKALAGRQVSIHSAARSEISTGVENKKESCGCCAERRARLQKKIQQARERRRAAQQPSTPLGSQQQPSAP